MAEKELETIRLARGDAPRASGRWRLVVVGEAGTSSHALPPTGDVVLGRGDDATLKVDDAAASRRHAVLHLGPTVRVEDLQSANGTTVRGRKLDAGEIATLAAGDTVEFGTTLAVLQPDELSAASKPWSLVTHGAFLEAVDATRAPFAVVRLQVAAPPGIAQEVLSAELSPHDTVASFGPGQFEVLAPGRTPVTGRALMEKLSARLVAAGARVRAGLATAPEDGRGAEALVAACARPASAPAPGFVVRDDAMEAIYRLLDRVAPSQLNVLLLGETGVGKEVLSAEVHRRSKRAAGAFLRLNCAALTETLLESELFGHEKGAFTGAVVRKVGLLESARGGTVMLDEVGEMPLGIQAKLLRVLEERRVLRVGAVTPEPIDVRFIFATNRDLEAEVARGAFRSDLYYRVNGISILVPPLRDRASEIEPLARKFAEEASRREGVPPMDFTPDALKALQQWPWPGNIRELRNVVDRAVLLATEGAITVESLGLAGKAKPPEAAPRDASTVDSTDLRAEREAAEKRAILDALDKTGGNQTRAAELLGISRRTLVSRLQEYGLTRPRKRLGEGDTGE